MSRYFTSNGTKIGFEVCVLALIFFLLYQNDILGRIREDVVFAVLPSAEKAYAYGDAHFRALNSRQYDIDRAKYWYSRSLALDEHFPGVEHQLARIAFLKGDFPTAMQRINLEIAQPNGPVTASSFYIRGLIEGYMKNYTDSAKDYERYLQSDPHNWAALNDYAWVLLKGKRFKDAIEVTTRGLAFFPTNPWLLNSQATALSELGRYREALVQVQKAKTAVAQLSAQQWLTAYPGNDPKAAGEGLRVFRKAIDDNMHTITLAISSSTVQ